MALSLSQGDALPNQEGAAIMDSRMPPGLLRISTANVRPADRLDFWANTLSTAVIPMSVERAVPDGFEAQMSATALGGLSLVELCGSAHHVVRGRGELARSAERCFHLVMSPNSSWAFRHRREGLIRPGDVVLTDSEFGYDLKPNGAGGPLIHFLTLKLPVAWLRTWIAHPHEWVGRPIECQSGWARALSSFMSELTPEFVANAPLPPRLFADHVGSLLALVVDQQRGSATSASVAERSQRDRIRDCIAQRSSETHLTAADIASTLNMSVRTLHRTLAASNETFGRLLLDARVERASGMLRSPSLRRLTIGEIGRRCGFADASHFSRVIGRHTGLTPARHRASVGLPEDQLGRDGATDLHD